MYLLFKFDIASLVYKNTYFSITFYQKASAKMRKSSVQQSGQYLKEGC